MDIMTKKEQAIFLENVKSFVCNHFNNTRKQALLTVRDTESVKSVYISVICNEPLFIPIGISAWDFFLSKI
jgi:hypothetical protein